MWSLLIAILGLGAISAFQIVFFKLKLVSTLPTTICGLMLVLYILAFFNKLSLIDWIFLLLFAILVPFLVFSKIQDKKGRLKSGLLNPSSLIMVGTILITIIGMYSLSIVAYDDFKFWASTVKSLYYQDGYGAPYTNIDPRFGDYPQGALLLLWIGEHCSGVFRENTLYISYTIVSLCFLMPLTNNIKKYRYIPIAIILIFAFSSAFTLFGASLEPDRMMALVYGSGLVSAFNSTKKISQYYYIQFVLTCCCVTIIKSVGILWSLFLIVFLFLISYRIKTKKRIKKTIIALFSTMIVYCSWNYYCLAFGREAYLTQEMHSSIGMPISETASHIVDYLFVIKMYVKVLLLMPANCADRFDAPFPLNGLMLSPVCYIILFYIVLYLIKRSGIINLQQFKITSIFFLAIYVLYYGILLWSYLFMFYTEFTAENVSHMQNMTSHYAEPALVGNLMLLLRFMLITPDHTYLIKFKTGIKVSSHFFVCVMLVLIVSFPTTFFMLFGEAFGINSHEATKAQQESSDNQNAELVDAVRNVDDPLNSRVLIADERLGRNGVGFCYVNYELSPISTVNILSLTDVHVLDEEARAQNCNYVYIGPEYADFTTELKEVFGNDFEIGQLIKIDERSPQSEQEPY